MARSEFRKYINLIFKMVAVAHIFKASGLSDRLLLAAVLVFALAMITACGSLMEEGAAESVATGSVQQDSVTVVPGSVEVAAVKPATPTSIPAEAVSQSPTATLVPFTPMPAGRTETATTVPATTESTSVPMEPTAANAPAAEVPATATPGPTATVSPTDEVPDDSVRTVLPERDFDVITLLPPDAIPALNSPGYHDTTEEADQSYHDDDLVLGIEINGDARAFSVPLLSRHEIVNDVIGGEPVAVTW